MLNGSPIGVNLMELICSVLQFDVKLWVVNMWPEGVCKVVLQSFYVGYIFFWGHTVCKLWLSGQIALNIRVIMWKNDVTV